jgi:hypothetical protein
MKDSDSYEKMNPQPNQSKGYMKEDGKWVSNYASLPLMGTSAGGAPGMNCDLRMYWDAGFTVL